MQRLPQTEVLKNSSFCYTKAPRRCDYNFLITVYTLRNIFSLFTSSLYSITANKHPRSECRMRSDWSSYIYVMSCVFSDATKKSCDWFYNDVRSRFKRFGSAKVVRSLHKRRAECEWLSRTPPPSLL